MNKSHRCRKPVCGTPAFRSVRNLINGLRLCRRAFQNRRRIITDPVLEYDFVCRMSLLGRGFRGPRRCRPLYPATTSPPGRVPQSTAPLCVRSESLARAESRTSTSNSTSCWITVTAITPPTPWVNPRHQQSTGSHKLALELHFFFSMGPHTTLDAGNQRLLRRVNNPELRCKQAYYTVIQQRNSRSRQTFENRDVDVMATCAPPRCRSDAEFQAVAHPCGLVRRGVPPLGQATWCGCE